MAIAVAGYRPPIKEIQSSWRSLTSLLDPIPVMLQYVLDRIDRRGLTEVPSKQSSSAVESPSISDVLKFAVPPSTDKLKRDLKDFGTKPLEEFRKCLSDQEIRSLLPMPVRVLSRNPKFEIAYQALADRRGANATPAGRAASRKVWLDAGADAAKWLIDRLRTEQHPETIIGIAETLTDLGAMALPIALAELERDEAKPEYALLVEALAWMTPPSQPLLMSRIAYIIDRYLASSHIDCQVAAVQLTRILDDDMARTRLDEARRNAGQRLREEIEDLLEERFGE